jgi:hypothetical protein
MPKHLKLLCALPHKEYHRRIKIELSDPEISGVIHACRLVELALHAVFVGISLGMHLANIHRQ